MLYPKDSTCRTCLTNSHIIYSMYDEENCVSIKTKMKIVTNLKLSDNKLLPTGLCDICKKDLNVAYNFILKCYASEKKLIESIAEIKEESEKDLTDEFGVKLESEEEFDNRDNSEYFSPVKLESSDADDHHIGIPTKNLFHQKPVRRAKAINDANNTKNKPRKRKKMALSNSIQCYTCGLICISHSALTTHQRIHTGERPFKCLQCHLSFAQKGTMKAHMQRKHSLGTQPSELCYVCETCGKQFSRRRDAVIHMRLHTGEKPYACPFCPKRFTQIGPLIRHKRIHTGEKPYSCHECGKTFADKTMVKMHSTVHSNDKNYKCTICGKAVKSKNTLIKHIKLHSQDKSNVCFALKGNLKLHIAKVHSEKSGICLTCSKTCSDLAKHMRKHTGEAPFTCSICNRSFTLNSSLTTHMNKHKNAEKFKCSIDNCTKAFPMEFMLDFHIKKYHTNETPFICSLCGRGFFRVGDLTKHLRATHNIEK